MRAFMSNPGDGPLYYDGETLAYVDGRTFAAPNWEHDSTEAIRLATFAAEREARRILAETEPDQGVMRFHAYLTPAVGTPFGDALADALRAFVKED